MAASNVRAPGSRSGSLEELDEPPSYVNRAYAPTGSAAAAAAQPGAAAYGRRFQPNAAATAGAAAGGHQRLYGEQQQQQQRAPRSRSQSPAQLLDSAYANGQQQQQQQAPGGGLYGERSVTPVSGVYRLPGQQQQQMRSQSPARYLEEGSSSRQPPQYGRASSPASYYSQQPSAPVASRGAAANQGYYTDSSPPPRPNPQGRLYSQRPYYPGYNAARYGRPKHVSVTREPGYYNLNTDTVVRTKKHRNKTYLYVGRPWTKGFSTTPRDFLPLAVMSIFFSPPVGIVALVFALLSRHSARKEDYAAAGFRGRAAFWSSVSAIIVGIVCWIVIVAAANKFNFIGHRIH